ncbi:PREDICTED: uncharacterized protein LOC109155168 [Ipomoea nil]|uniref:uncharacterized protein LOC109155168 n=1 Tax=Ipomoea nil TaxID=35883 RepID=UPI00090127B4|nr:PREDICTED: uncharacterized protein LOC109155168 [Ipomoea nil]
MSSFSDEVMPLAIGHRTSRAVWTAVIGALASSSCSQGLNLLGQLQTLDQGDISAVEYIGKAMVLAEELALAGRPMTLEKQNLYVLQGLRPEFRGLTSSLIVHGQPITLQEPADLLGGEEFMTRDGLGGGSPAAFTAQKGGQKGHSSGRGNGGRGSDQNNGQNSSQTGQPRGGGGGRGRGGGCRGGGRNDNWQLATQVSNIGVTNHATLDIATLSFLEDYNGNDTLRVGDGMGLPISRIGHATFNSPSRSFQLSNILCVPSLSTSLLSVQKFASENKVFFEFHPSFFVVKDIKTMEILLRDNSSGGLYKLPIPSSSPTAFLSATASTSVWHDRLGHPHQRVLSQILSSCSVSGYSSNIRYSSGLCNACQLGKSARFPLPRVESSSSCVLDLIYTDI